MNDKNTPKSPAQSERELRLAAQLRTNLRRRKAASRKHKAKDGEN